MSDAVHVIIQGRVQGVGYRAFVEHEAGRLGLRGFVRNRRDGTVEAVFDGPAEAVRAMIALCRTGPWGARIDGVDRREASADELALAGTGRPFAVLPTA